MVLCWYCLHLDDALPSPSECERSHVISQQDVADSSTANGLLLGTVWDLRIVELVGARFKISLDVVGISYKSDYLQNHNYRLFHTPKSKLLNMIQFIWFDSAFWE